MAEACIFCDVDEKSLIYRDHDGIVILDDPVRPGHVLVGAVEHGASLQDVSPEAAAGVLRLANRVSKHVVQLADAEKVYVAAIGDKDKHFHVHLLPKRSGDPNLGPYIFGEAGWISFLPPKPDQGELDELNAALRERLGQ